MEQSKWTDTVWPHLGRGGLQQVKEVSDGLFLKYEVVRGFGAGRDEASLTLVPGEINGEENKFEEAPSGLNQLLWSKRVGESHMPFPTISFKKDESFEDALERLKRKRQFKKLSEAVEEGEIKTYLASFYKKQKEKGLEEGGPADTIESAHDKLMSYLQLPVKAG